MCFKRRTLILLFATSCVTVGTVFSQVAAVESQDGTRYGVAGVACIGLDLHAAPIRGLPGIPSCCPEYSTASAMMPAIDLMAHLRMSDPLRLELRVGYDLHAALLEAEQTQVIAPRGVDESILLGYELSTSRSFLSLAPIVAYDVMPKLSLLGGLRLGFLMSSSFSQREFISAPADVVFADGNRTRFEFDSSLIPGASSTRFAAVVGVRYSIPISSDEQWRLEPELVANIGVSDLQASQPWSLTSVRLGVGLAWQNYSDQAPPIPVQEPAPIVEQPVVIAEKPIEKVAPAPVTKVEEKPKRLLINNLTSRMLDAEGKPLDNAKLTVSNIISLNLYALLNYIFFDEASAEIPQRYRRIAPSEVSSYTLDRLNGAGTVAIYHDLLNIVGYKLRTNPSEKIIVIGCNSNAGDERGNRDLSRQRAMNVAQYLTNTWGIDASRVAIQARDLPENPSNINVPDGVTENRRVEIVGQDTRLLDPIFFTDTVRTVNVETVELNPNVTADTIIKEWNLVISQGADKLDTLSGSDSLPRHVLWNIGNRVSAFPRNQESLEYSLSVTDVTGQQLSSRSRGYDVEQLYRTDKRLERFNMIIFGYNESEFTKQHERILATIRPRISKNSKVTVEGYTDRVGNPDYNLRLSERRAKAVGSKLNLPSENSIGYGSAGELFDNNTPEGRLYSRTVIITIETPLE